MEDDKSNLISTPVPIKVLSCDSITQVKEKIVDQFYKNIPFSKRPSIDDFDIGMFRIDRVARDNFAFFCFSRSDRMASGITYEITS